MITVSAPGKLLVFGEHAVVYGKPCVVMGIDKRVSATIEKNDTDTVIIDAPDIGITGFKYAGNIEEPQFVCASIKHFEKKTGVDVKGVKITTKSDMNMGFGTSSASTVSTIGALNEYFETNLSKADIFRVGYDVVLDVQNGKGSGFDIAAGVYGGLFSYKKGEIPEPITDKEFPFVIGHTGIKVKTVPIVNQVKERYDRNEGLIGGIFDQIGDLSIQSIKAIKDYDLERMGELMNMNQGLLYALGVSSGILEELIFASKGAGAIGAKLSGAGVGDYMIALCPDKETEVRAALNSTNGSASDATMSPKGMIVHNK